MQNNSNKYENSKKCIHSINLRIHCVMNDDLLYVINLWRACYMNLFEKLNGILIWEYPLKWPNVKYWVFLQQFYNGCIHYIPKKLLTNSSIFFEKMKIKYHLNHIYFFYFNATKLFSINFCAHVSLQMFSYSFTVMHQLYP